MPVSSGSVGSPPPGQLSGAQRQRRRRIIDSAVELASQGGYDAVQMRSVAAMADVALGTLYRYFSSKEHLLIVAMAEQVSALHHRLDERPPRAESPADRVAEVMHRATRALQSQPLVTAAMLKSLISANTEVAETMQPVDREMTAIITGAMHPGEPSGHDLDVAQVVQHVWVASLLWWVAGQIPARRVDEVVAKAVHLLLDGEASEPAEAAAAGGPQRVANGRRPS